VGSLPAATGATLVLIDSTQPKRVYAANETTLYRSDDAGQTWQPASRGLPEDKLTGLTLDPRQPQRLYAATAAGSLYVSEDGATTWRALPGAGANAAT